LKHVWLSTSFYVLKYLLEHAISLVDRKLKIKPLKPCAKGVHFAITHTTI
jgi:hypothetical protein